MADIMKFAIIGSGISGLACAHLLKKNHEVVLFEAANKPGGHVNTVDVKGRTGDYRVDTGFIVFNEQNYPNFVRLLKSLDVQSQPTRTEKPIRVGPVGDQRSVSCHYAAGLSQVGRTPAGSDRGD